MNNENSQNNNWLDDIFYNISKLGKTYIDYEKGQSVKKWNEKIISLLPLIVVGVFAVILVRK